MRTMTCAVCGYRIDAVIAMTDVRPAGPIIPRTGDLSICSCCLSIGVVQADGSFRTATTEECNYVPHWARVQIADTMRQLMGHHKPS
jgi:hypothetical protein